MTTVAQFEIVISEKCNRCGMCAEYCAFGVIVLENKGIKVCKSEDCNGCSACVDVCPQQAISIKKNSEPEIRINCAAGEKELLLPVEKVKKFVNKILINSGVPYAEAMIVADSLLEADLRGIESHGLARLPGYLKRIEQGLMLPNTEFAVLSCRGVVLVCDAGNGWGQVAGIKAMELCMEKAKKYGAGIATIRGSNHFGIASYYTLAASKAGFIGIAMGNTGPSMAAWGGNIPVLGTNPISISAPAPWGDFCVDMALTTVAKSKIRLAAREGRFIPADWALDVNGKPTTDPQSAIEGTLQPAGGAKGYAAALIVDLLSGILSGGAYATDVHGSHDSRGIANVSQFLAVINPGFFLEPNDFTQRLADWADKIKAGQTTIRLPGERTGSLRVRTVAEGLKMRTKTRTELELLAQKMQIPVPW